MSEITIPYKVYKQIANYMATSDAPEHSNISIREISCGIGSSYELKISKTRSVDIPGFESGIYAVFSDLDSW
jgi:hypothetical protein